MQSTNPRSASNLMTTRWQPPRSSPSAAGPSRPTPRISRNSATVGANRLANAERAGECHSPLWRTRELELVGARRQLEPSGPSGCPPMTPDHHRSDKLRWLPQWSGPFAKRALSGSLRSHNPAAQKISSREFPQQTGTSPRPPSRSPIMTPPATYTLGSYLIGQLPHGWSDINDSGYGTTGTVG